VTVENRELLALLSVTWLCDNHVTGSQGNEPKEPVSSLLRGFYLVLEGNCGRMRTSDSEIELLSSNWNMEGHYASPMVKLGLPSVTEIAQWYSAGLETVQTLDSG